MTGTFAKLDTDPRPVAVGLWVRRAVMALLAVVVVAALANRFGQRATKSTARVPAATMRVTSPETVRGGLFFQSLLEVRAARAIDHPRFVLDRGWVEGMPVNSIERPSQHHRAAIYRDGLAGNKAARIRDEPGHGPDEVGRR